MAGVTDGGLESSPGLNKGLLREQRMAKVLSGSVKDGLASASAWILLSLQNLRRRR